MNQYELLPFPEVCETPLAPSFPEVVSFDVHQALSLILDLDLIPKSETAVLFFEYYWNDLNALETQRSLQIGLNRRNYRYSRHVPTSDNGSLF